MASIGPRPSPSCLLQRGGEGGNRAINQADGCSQNPWRRWLHRGSESKSGRPRGCCLGSCSSKANGMGRCMKCRVPGVAKLFSRFGRCCRESGSCWSASRSSRPTPLCPCRQAVLFPCAHSLWEGKKHGAPPHPPHCSNVCVSALHLPFQAGWVLLGQLCFWQSASGNLLLAICFWQSASATRLRPSLRQRIRRKQQTPSRALCSEIRCPNSRQRHRDGSVLRHLPLPPMRPNTMTQSTASSSIGHWPDPTRP